MTSNPKRIGRLRSYQDDITDQESQEAYEAAVTATEEWMNCRGYQLKLHLTTISHSVDLLNGNSQELIGLLDDFKQESPEIYWDEIQEFGTEFPRYLFNFVSAAKSMENHVEKVLSDIDNMCGERPLPSKEYDKKISEFNVDVHGAFFTSLRNIQVHKNMIEYYSIHWDEKEYRYAIPTKEILNDDEWSAAAKGYAESCGEHVFMQNVIESYDQSLENLYNWLIDYLEDEFVNWLEKEDELAETARKLQDEFFDVCGIELMSVKWPTTDDIA